MGEHGVALSSNCVSPRCVGEFLSCTASFAHFDDFDDDITLTDASATASRLGGPVPVSIEIAAVFGNASCAAGDTALPCTVSAASPGVDPGRVQFRIVPNSHQILPTDPTTINTMFRFTFEDECNGVEDQGCPAGISQVVTTPALTTRPTCNDNNACTTDSCSNGICSNTPIVCNDQNACTTDTCNPASGCVFSTISCNDGNLCTVDSCNPNTGCDNTVEINCNDSNPCTADSCAPASGCVNDTIPDDLLCEEVDEDPCTNRRCNPNAANPQQPCVIDVVAIGDCAPGACCFPDTCEITTRGECESGGGVFTPGATSCLQVDCSPCICPADVNAQDRLKNNDSNEFEFDVAKKAKLCPQVIPPTSDFPNGVIDIANTHPELNVGDINNPFWDSGAPGRVDNVNLGLHNETGPPYNSTTKGFPLGFDPANVNIMELTTCTKDRCVFSDGQCVAETGEHPDTVFVSVNGTKRVKVYLRQRCLLQQRKDQNGNPVLDGQGRQLTTPLCVAGFQAWIRWNASALNLISVDPSPQTNPSMCIFKDSPFGNGFIGTQTEPGRAFVAAGIRDGECPTANDGVIAVFTFEARSGFNGSADIAFDPTHIFGQIDIPQVTAPIRWSRRQPDATGNVVLPVYPNLKNRAKVVVDNIGPCLESCPEDLVVECGNNAPPFSNNFGTDISPENLLRPKAQGGHGIANPLSVFPSVCPPGECVVQGVCVPVIVGPPPGDANLDAPACVTFSDQILRNCGHQFTAKRTWKATDCAGNVATCDLQIIDVVDTLPPEWIGPVLRVPCVNRIPAPLLTDMNGDMRLDPMEFSMIGDDEDSSTTLVEPGLIFDRCGEVFAVFKNDYATAPDAQGNPTSPPISFQAVPECPEQCPHVIWRLYVAADVCPPIHSTNVWMRIEIRRTSPPTLIPGTLLANIDTFADAGKCTAVVDANLLRPRARDACGCDVSLIGGVTGKRSDGLTLNDPFPTGCITVTWTIKDCDGNEKLIDQSKAATDSNRHKTVVCVEPFNIVKLDVEYGIQTNATDSPLPDFRRCVTLNLSNCGAPAPAGAANSAEQETLMSFKNVGTRKVPITPSQCKNNGNDREVHVYVARDQKILVPCGKYTCIEARDILHTLASVSDGNPFGEQNLSWDTSQNKPFRLDTSVKPSRYLADFVGVRPDEPLFCTANPFKHTDNGANPAGAANRNRLVVGNLNDRVREQGGVFAAFIDIVDFGIFIGQVGRSFTNADNTCETKPFHADLLPDGLVNSADFSFISANFLLREDDPCCGPAHDPGDPQPSVASGPRTSITVEELREMGLGSAVLADLNGDGVVDVADMEAFAAGARPVRIVGDFDFDGDVDMADYLLFQACFSGAGEAAADGCGETDLDGDGDVDLSDLIGFQTGFTGSQ